MSGCWPGVHVYKFAGGVGVGLSGCWPVVHVYQFVGGVSIHVYKCGRALGVGLGNLSVCRVAGWLVVWEG